MPHRRVRTTGAKDGLTTVDEPISRFAPPLTSEIVPCLVCGSDQPKRLYTETYRLMGASVRLGINGCRSCGQVYVSPRLDRASTEFVYRLDTDHTISHNYCWQGEMDDHRFGPLLQRLLELAPSGRLLDIGCGGGHFLAAAGRHGRWQRMGLEPNPDAAASAQAVANCRVHATTLDQAALESAGARIVTLLGVLEHLHDPCRTLHRVHELLEPAGLLAIYVPNFHYLRWKDAGPLGLIRHGRWSNLFPQEHLFQFTPRTLCQLLSRTGFELLRMDVGQPFVHGRGWRYALKHTAYAAANSLHRLTGVCIGGIEVLARRTNSAANSAAA